MFLVNLYDNPDFVNSFIDIYAKSGNLIYSKFVFDMMPTKYIINWNMLMTGSVLHGYSGVALRLLNHMREEGLERVFSIMTHDYNILPCLDHCTTMGLMMQLSSLKIWPYSLIFPSGIPY